MAGDTGNEIGVEVFQHPEIMPYDVIDAGILQSYGVEHACRRLGDTRRGVALPRFERHGFEDYGADV